MLQLGQNYPEPFNPSTTIKYALPADMRVTIKIFNILGQQMRTLANEIQPAGRKNIQWDGKDDFGKPAASGIYFVQLKAGEQRLVKKITLQK